MGIEKVDYKQKIFYEYIEIEKKNYENKFEAVIETITKPKIIKQHKIWL